MERPARSAPAAPSQLSAGQRIADRVAAIVGSWRFIIVQTTLLLLWITLNVAAYLRH